MNTISFEEFEKNASLYNLIPLVREVLADAETPISIAAKLEKKGKYFLLESVEGGESWGRYSILGFNIKKEFFIRNGKAILKIGNKETNLLGNPIEALRSYLKDLKPQKPEGLPRFIGGAVGYFSFETVRFFERCGITKKCTEDFPDAYFMITDQVAVFDNINKTVKLICCVHVNEFSDIKEAYQYGLNKLDCIGTILSETHHLTPNLPNRMDDYGHTDKKLVMTSNMLKEDYEEIVRKAKKYICEGDIIQVVLAQHFKSDISASHLDVYRALRFINPSPYLYYLKLDDNKAIAGSSPEVMVRVTHKKVEIRPIAGTCPRGKSEEEDRILEDRLKNDPKEQAEHVMLVDLARNDLGRISKIGSVHVKDYMFVEKYSHVMHLVSEVNGTVSEEYDAIDVLKASFPAGTLSGAPKVRAMEIINELEPDVRGPYGGALGYIGYGCDMMDMAITIRTIIMNKNTATVTAGAGIVFDSVPEKEFNETVHKSNGMRRALKLAENKLYIGYIR